jgi:D-alanine-D-alanine ligase-like ATP-grasp enzyme
MVIGFTDFAAIMASGYIIFPAMHGAFGADGTIQGLFDKADACSPSAGDWVFGIWQ